MPPAPIRQRPAVSRSAAVAVTSLVLCSATLAPAAPAQDPGEQVVLLRLADPGRREHLLAQAREAVRQRTARPDLVRALVAEAQAAADTLGGWLAQHDAVPTAVLWSPPAVVLRIGPALLPELRRRPEVALVHDNRIADGALAVATNGQNHSADHVQNVLGLRGAGALLAHLDSGVQLQFPGGGVHPAFRDALGQSRVVAAYNLSAAPSASDDHGHGTMVAAIAAGRRWHPTSPLADDGFAPDAGIVVYRIASSSLTAPVATIAQGYQRVLADAIAGVHRPHAAICSFRGSPDPLAVDQRALDELAEVGDVVVVTAAGNDALAQPQPSALSQATVNGLAVGAVTPNAHAVAPFSTFGPMAGDGARTFPDLCAVGDGLTLPALQTNGVVTGQSGTSFAAPMVAGTALVLRAARPDLDALETRALLLHALQDVSAANPGLGRNHFGLGMLRTDLAAEDALALQPGGPGVIGLGTSTLPAPHLLRDTLQAGGPAAMHWQLDLKQGEDYAFTLAWWRGDTTTSQWADLDLALADPTGRLVAVARSPRNTYERLRFRAVQSGHHQLTVTATVLPAPSVKFALVAGPARGGGRQDGHYQTVGQGCAGTGPDPQRGIVLPAATTGGGRTQFPLASGPLTLQQSFAGTAFGGPTTITALAFRRAGDQSHSPGWRAQVEVRMGYTSLLAAQLAPNLSQNRNGSMTTALPPTWLDLRPAAGIPDPGEFDYVVPLAQPFTYDPQQGHLLLEVQLLGNNQNNAPADCWLDAHQGPGHGRAYSFVVGGTTFTLTDDRTTTVAVLTAASIGAVPRLDWRSAPMPGGTLQVILRQAAPSAPTVLLQGHVDTNWNGQPLPWELGGLGAPGCVLRLQPDALLAVLTDAAGATELALPLPADPALVGLTVLHQFATLDAAANALGLTLSDAGWGLVGG